MSVRQVAVPAMTDLDAAWDLVCARLRPTPLVPAAELGVHATVVVAETASPAKVAALQALPVTLVQHGAAYDDAEAHALALAAEGATYVSSYNDTGLIAGMSTIGRELETQLAAPFAVACPVGGGGLASALGL